MLSQYQYDEQGRLQAHSVSQQQQGQQQRNLYRRAYAYDANGNLSGIDDSRKGNLRYHYDPLDRLINVRGVTPETFAHDPAGNLLGQGDQPAANLANVKGNRLLMQGDRHYDYDAFGNLSRERRGAGQKLVTEYQYDCQHRLIGVSLPGGSTATYKYDAFGRRVAKTVDGRTTEFLWQGEKLIVESGENRYRSYIYEPGTFRPLAMLDGEGPIHATPFYYQLDHLGTPQELTAYSGEIMWSAKYRAYGNVVALDVQEIDNPLRFQGQYFDTETGLHYNRHRYYNPSSGRFLTPDPINLAGGLNNYQYVNNPTGWVDPLGLNGCPGSTPHKGTPISNNAKHHMEKADGYSTKTGIKGAHNRDEFMQAIKDNNLHIISETQSPTVPGLSEITYGRDSLDRAGKPTGMIKEFGNPKTVYDPKLITTDSMYNAAKDAAASGYSAAKSSGNRVYSSSHNGLNFRIHLDETLTTFTNFHPTMK